MSDAIGIVITILLFFLIWVTNWHIDQRMDKLEKIINDKH